MQGGRVNAKKLRWRCGTLFRHLHSDPLSSARAFSQDCATQQPPPPPEFQPTAAETSRLQAGYDALVLAISVVESRAPSDLVPDVTVYASAVGFLLRYPEQYYKQQYYSDALELLAEGMRRVKELESGTCSWTTKRGIVCRGYRSAVDGSIQPYCVWVPDGYRAGVPSRLDVILHGRNRVLTEVSFLSSAWDERIVEFETGRKSAPDCLKLYVFGRANNSYRWAGESDVFEALASTQANYTVDPERVVLRGFSMGGTGAWHLGLHFPSRWAAVEAGAGYVETRCVRVRARVCACLCHRFVSGMAVHTPNETLWRAGPKSVKQSPTNGGTKL